MTSAQVVVKIVREKLLSRKSALFVEVPTILQKNVWKVSERKSKKLVRMVFRTKNVQKARLVNVLDTYLNIALLLNVWSHPKIIRNGKIKYVSVKEVIVHLRKNVTTVIITTTKTYMHLWHVCLIMTNVLVEILVTAHNWPIGFKIQNQHVIWRQRFRISFRVS